MKKGVENFKRRTWDEAEYSKLALEREDLERAGKKPSSAATTTNKQQEDPITVDTDFAKLHYADANAAGPSGSAKAYLDVEKSRADLDLDSKVGKVEKIVGGARQAGYHCTVCDRVFQDSSALLDHMNGREHQSRLGYSMQLQPSSKHQVKSRLAAHVAKATTMALRPHAHSSSGSTVEGKDSLEERVKKATMEQEVQNAAKKQGKYQKKQKVAEENHEKEEVASQDPDMMAAMGFGSFGGGN